MGMHTFAQATLNFGWASENVAFIVSPCNGPLPYKQINAAN